MATLKTLAVLAISIAMVLPASAQELSSLFGVHVYLAYTGRSPEPASTLARHRAEC
jgi:hypothetical protein